MQSQIFFALFLTISGKLNAHEVQVSAPLTVHSSRPLSSNSIQPGSADHIIHHGHSVHQGQPSFHSPIAGKRPITLHNGTNLRPHTVHHDIHHAGSFAHRPSASSVPLHVLMRSQAIGNQHHHGSEKLKVNGKQADDRILIAVLGKIIKGKPVKVQLSERESISFSQKRRPTKSEHPSDKRPPVHVGRPSLVHQGDPHPVVHHGRSRPSRPNGPPHRPTFHPRRTTSHSTVNSTFSPTSGVNYNATSTPDSVWFPTGHTADPIKHNSTSSPVFVWAPTTQTFFTHNGTASGINHNVTSSPDFAWSPTHDAESFNHNVTSSTGFLNSTRKPVSQWTEAGQSVSQDTSTSRFVESPSTTTFTGNSSLRKPETTTKVLDSSRMTTVASTRNSTVVEPERSTFDFFNLRWID